jgi:hypothetical protein
VSNKTKKKKSFCIFHPLVFGEEEEEKAGGRWEINGSTLT